MARHWWRCTAMAAVGSVVVAAVAVPAPAVTGQSKAYNYVVHVSFEQKGNWTYDGLLAATPCTLADAGFGSDRVRLGAITPFVLGRGARPGVTLLSLAGPYERVGTMTHTVSGAECDTAGTTQTESTAGCGEKDTLGYAKLTLSGRKLTLHWTPGWSAPRFECPYFGGSEDAADGAGLPGEAFLDATITFDPTPFRLGTRRFAVAKRVVQEATQDCASLVQGCSEGVSFRAAGRSESYVVLIFVRGR